MSKTLVIVESPTKAKTISKFLGKDFLVESSFGHIRDLPKSTMGIDIEGGTFEPTYEISAEKKKQVKKLKDAMKTCDHVIFATDEDREGEAISWHLAHILKIKPEEAKRMVFHEITKHAIEEALAHPRALDQPLVDAQQARRILDRLVGYELSPFLWKKVARGLSAGRVQSVAVRLIVERERERNAFIQEEYWTMDGLFAKTPTDEQIFGAKLHAIEGKKLDKLAIKNEQEAQTILQDLEHASYTITDITKKEAKRTPPPPYRTSTLQQQANQKCGYSSKQTMRIAQQLYEGISLGSGGTHGLITYMRTDSTNLSEKFITEATSFIGNEYGEKYILAKPRVYKNKAKGAQEAHEAIRPTDPTRTPESIKQYLDPTQFKLYSLVWKRAVATQMKEASINRTSIDITAKQYLFRANGQSMIFDGWLHLYPESIKHEMLPEMSKGDDVHCQSITPTQHFTEPQGRYSDATLVKALEERGIGRPSTYAPTIGTIEARKYVERDENKKLAPTDIAFVVNDLLVEHFSDIVNYNFTALMEDNLDSIAEGKKDWQPIIATFYHPFHENLVKKSENLDRADVVNMREVGIHPKNGKPLYVRVGRYGAFVQCGSKDDEEKPQFASLPKGMSMDDVTVDDAMKLLSLPRTIGQDAEGNDMIINIGRFGPYVKVKSKFYSIKEKDPYTITKEDALAIIAEKKEEEANRIIHDFPEEHIQVLRGRYGPYITDGEKNAKIPKDTEPEALTLHMCQELLKEAKPARGKIKKKIPTQKKASPVKNKTLAKKKKAGTKAKNK
ncbi:MAG: type I DNA topoisomerase [Candidatus Magasanikbacteria bacterium]|uniref:DNA topoisomerase 1 n=1 Tax=Candidatus Magasanikbacteria bacterium CG10_big_fil_rev_8_21_14_0_10_38_6 TaxID=1974647 RepID=A0A2M6NZU6_9BACT|nr:type I DNA topoisomerase [Candidatus Magasanikbacteria bacterium]NCS71873.1 type I DNA topoisomerase [Candidatus Magasanikbacteria bacterium]PIR77003.1 MAG: type I DNA topoisomerase [Candidatus Magasanikbacteria bacterium CG10_big_fil_rev_8_21_14_0_10_38_6]